MILSLNTIAWFYAPYKHLDLQRRLSILLRNMYVNEMALDIFHLNMSINVLNKDGSNPTCIDLLCFHHY